MIREVSPTEAIKYKKWIEKAHDPEWPAERIFEGINEGFLKVLACDDIGVLVYSPRGIIAWIVWFYTLPGKGRNIVERIYDYLRYKGFKKVRAGSIRNERAFMKITSMRKLFTVYEIDL